VAYGGDWHRQPGLMGYLTKEVRLLGERVVSGGPQGFKSEIGGGEKGGERTSRGKATRVERGRFGKLGEISLLRNLAGGREGQFLGQKWNLKGKVRRMPVQKKKKKGRGWI